MKTLVFAVALLIATPAAAISATDKELLKLWDKLNEMCRGGHGNDPRTEQACEHRQKIIAELRQRGYCPTIRDRWLDPDECAVVKEEAITDERIEMWKKTNEVCLKDKSDVGEAKEACTLRDNIDAALSEKGYCNVEGRGWMNCEEADEDPE